MFRFAVFFINAYFVIVLITSFRCGSSRNILHEVTDLLRQTVDERRGSQKKKQMKAMWEHK